MKIGLLVATAIFCLHTDTVVAVRAKSRPCRTAKCKFRLNSRLRYLRDLSKSFYPDTSVIDVTLKTLNNRKEGAFATFDREASIGYDIPKLVCPQNEENVDMLPCPTPDSWNRIHCIDYFSLCDRKVHCPKGEDEDPTMCLFHTAADAYMKKMVRSMYRLFDKTQEATHTPTYLTYSYRRK